MIVNAGLPIRRFTPMAQRVLDLIATDIGRSMPMAANGSFRALCAVPDGGVHGRALDELGVGIDGLERLRTLGARGDDAQSDAVTLPVDHPEVPGAILTARAFPSSDSPSDRLVLLSLHPGSEEARVG